MGSFAVNVMSMTGDDDALFFAGETIFERARRVGILCETVLVLAGGVSSSGIGNTDTFPEAESVASATFPDVDIEKVRESESRGTEAEGFPCESVPFSTSQIYRKRSLSAIVTKRSGEG